MPISEGPLLFIPPIVATLYLAALARNPFPPGSPNYLSLRLCRTGAAFLWWTPGFGVAGLAFSLVAFILGIVGIVKGRAGYGAGLIVGAILLPVSAFLGIEVIAFAYLVLAVGSLLTATAGRRHP